MTELLPVASKNVDSTAAVSNVDQVIENIIAQYVVDDSNDDDIEVRPDNLTWTLVYDGSSLKEFPFTFNDVGIKPNIYEEKHKQKPL